jgi:hypothetical protein
MYVEGNKETGCAGESSISLGRCAEGLWGYGVRGLGVGV